MRLLLLSVYKIVGVLAILSQTVSAKDCVCELKNTNQFPMEKLDKVEKIASSCTKDITSAQLSEVDTQLLGLNHRLRQLEKDVEVLEREDDGDLYGAVSLRIIEIELANILELMEKLNTTRLHHQSLSSNALRELQAMQTEMKELERYGYAKVVKRGRTNL